MELALGCATEVHRLRHLLAHFFGNWGLSIQEVSTLGRVSFVQQVDQVNHTGDSGMTMHIPKPALKN